MRSNENLSQKNEQTKNPTLERHEKKLVGFYLSGGDQRFIFNSSNPKFSEDQATPQERTFVLKAMASDQEVYQDLENNLLRNISRSNPPKSNEQVFQNIQDDKHEKRILAYMTGVNWQQFDTVSSGNIDRFLSKYPTPMDFEKASDAFLQLILDNNSVDKYYEYADSMESFCGQVYGKKYEYFKAMKSMHEEAMEKFGHEEVLHTRKEKRHFGQKIFKLWGEKHEEERPVADSGLATFNKGNFIGQPERQNEDAAYYNPKEGIFGVFDGAGGMSGAAKASEIAVAVMREMVEDNIPESTDDMKEIMESINDTIYYDPASGHSTGVIGRVIEENGKKSLLYSSVGDSRIYLIRDGKAKQITIDEGSGNVIYNSLGRSSAEIKQAGKISLKKGDNIVFCSDGITGDFEKDFIPDDELAEIVEQSSSATKAANALIRRATKIDDRTALVVRV